MSDKPASDLEQLLRYQQKRDFTQTAEPAGGDAPACGDRRQGDGITSSRRNTVGYEST